MATQQLADLTTRFNGLSTMTSETATGLADYLNDGGLVQLGEELSHELEKKGAPPARVPGSSNRYLVVTMTQRLAEGNEILGYLSRRAPPLAPFRTEKYGYDDDLSAFAYFIAGMGYTKARVADFTVEEVQTLRELSGIGTDGHVDWDAALINGMLQSIVEDSAETQMKEELKLREGFSEDLGRRAIAFRDLILSKDIETPGADRPFQNRYVLVRFRNFIAGCGFGWEDIQRFQAVDFADLYQLLEQGRMEMNMGSFEKGLLWGP